MPDGPLIKTVVIRFRNSHAVNGWYTYPHEKFACSCIHTALSRDFVVFGVLDNLTTSDHPYYNIGYIGSRSRVMAVNAKVPKKHPVNFMNFVAFHSAWPCLRRTASSPAVVLDR